MERSKMNILLEADVREPERMRWFVPKSDFLVSCTWVGAEWSSRIQQISWRCREASVQSFPTYRSSGPEPRRAHLSCLL
jgi:hypothetical protein